MDERRWVQCGRSIVTIVVEERPAMMTVAALCRATGLRQVVRA